VAGNFENEKKEKRRPKSAAKGRAKGPEKNRSHQKKEGVHTIYILVFERRGRGRGQYAKKKGAQKGACEGERKGECSGKKKKRRRLFPMQEERKRPCRAEKEKG